MECFSLVFDNMIIKLDSSMVNILVQPLTRTCTSKDFLFNPLQPSVAFLYPLKTSENQRFSDIFRGYRKRPVARKGLSKRYLVWLTGWVIPLRTKGLWILVPLQSHDLRYENILHTPWRNTVYNGTESVLTLAPKNLKPRSERSYVFSKLKQNNKRSSEECPYMICQTYITRFGFII